MDEFPEAFERFERDVYIRNIRSFRQLIMAFSHWAGWRWRGTPRQVEALRIEALKRGILTRMERRFLISPPIQFQRRRWKHERISVKGKLQSRYRELKTGRFIKKPF